MKRLFTPFEQESVAAGAEVRGTGSWNGNYQESGDADGRNNLREKANWVGDCFLGGTGL